MIAYETVTEALKDLKARRFLLDFNLAFDNLVCAENNLRLHPTDFEIVEVHRFEGATNPSDEEVVYAVQTKGGDQKGVLVSAFGLYSDSISPELIQKLSIHH